ncbi:Replication factor-A carboxy-terminal domain protein [Arachis hypogaea]|uniref:Replication factor-A carboxy-terminal domain protein n=1 Tax=Arachis hypogaea TaxID=3818 RepID=A0A6B9V9F1_ARAHY|nr:Replication factor-A carboxy-terminal domain protein [Arachis hypogaea]
MQGLQQKCILQALRYRVAHFSAISSDEVMEYCADLSEVFSCQHFAFCFLHLHSFISTIYKMSLAIDALGKISPWKEAWSIEAKILTIWEDATIVNERLQDIDFASFEVVFPVADGTATTKSTTSLIVKYRLLVEPCELRESRILQILIPNPGLSVTSMDQILQKCVDYEYLIDFVGVLCGLKKRMDVECNGKILKVLTLEVFADGYQRPPVVILQSFKIKVNGDKVSLQNVINISRVLINPDMQETVNFLNQYGIASHHFSRLRSNEVGDLVCVIDDESFDWKLIRTIDNLKANNEDGQFFVVGKIKEIVEDPEWWFFSCVCGHPIVGDDNVFHCQLCRRDVQHFMISYRIKILVEDGTSCGMFVLLDSPATKLLGRTCSDVFLLLEDEIDDVSSDSAFSPIFEDFSRYGQLRSYENQVISGVPIQLHSIKEMLADILCAKIYSSASRNSTDDYTIPNRLISQLMNKKIVFIVDPRPVGYELNTSLHVVRAKFDLDPFVPHFPFEFKNPVQFHSNASIQCSSSSTLTVGQASPFLFSTGIVGYLLT